MTKSRGIGKGNGGERRPVEVRFWAKVDKTDTCWLWTGAIDPDGYGKFGYRDASGRVIGRGAHRIAHELAIGPIPAGLEVDHVWARGCTNRHCVNPAHLEAVTQRTNVQRSARSRRKGPRTHCAEGHLLSAENTYIRKDKGSRSVRCRQCQVRNDRARRSRERMRRSENESLAS